MTVNIGIFQREEEVVEAIRLLREAGIDHDDIRVIVKNAESAPLISTHSDVPVEDLAGIQDANDHFHDSDRILPFGAAGIPTSGHTGPGTSGTPTGYTGAFVIGSFHRLDGDGNTEDTLREVGIPAHASERCGEEVSAGRYLLLAETGDDTNASDILRHAGASDVIH